MFFFVALKAGERDVGGPMGATTRDRREMLYLATPIKRRIAITAAIT
jgi:hypothetical protein